MLCCLRTARQNSYPHTHSAKPNQRLEHAHRADPPANSRMTALFRNRRSSLDGILYSCKMHHHRNSTSCGPGFRSGTLIFLLGQGTGNNTTRPFGLDNL